MTFLGILENIVSDIIFVILAILLSWLWFHFSHRQKLQSFFRTSTSQRLVIYLSDLNILPFGAIGSLGKKLSYQGHAVAYGEMQGASQIKSLFTFIIPKLAETFQSLGTMLLSDAQVEIVISPRNQKELDSQSSFIALGSAAYNVAAAYIEALDQGVIKFQIGSMKLVDFGLGSYQHPPIAYSDTDENSYPGEAAGTASTDGPTPYVVPSGQMLPHYPTGSHPISEVFQNAADANNLELDKDSAILVAGLGPITDTTYGFVQRIVDKKANRALFYVAGLSEFSTTATSYYLASQWQELYNKYGQDKSFVVMLRFDPADRKKWSTILERDLS